MKVVETPKAVCSNCDDELLESYHVRYATQTLGPQLFPEFPYMCSSVAFDHVVFTAVLKATSVEGAVQAIKEAWPDAQVQKLVRGRTAFGHDDNISASNTYGAMACHTKKSFWARFSPFPQH